MECEDHDLGNRDRNFDVESVKKEIQRGRKLVSTSDFIYSHKNDCAFGEGVHSNESLSDKAGLEEHYKFGHVLETWIQLGF